MPYSFDNAERDPLIGTTLDDRYLIEQRIATGGFGAIYRARTASGEAIALKILHPRLASDPTMVARFRREGATLTQLHDPHTVTTLAVGETADGTPYIAMELLSGESLQDHLHRAGALPWQAAVAIARAVCSSLAEAHALGVVHRDLKPANIHVETRGGAVRVVKLIDFGIVKIVPGSAIDDGADLTSAGHMIGTYDYMSPEQLLGAECSGASDLYALGVVTYEMLTGRRPYPKVTSPASMMTAIVTQTPMRPSVLSAIPPELDRIVMRCLEREPAARFAGVTELARELDRLLALRVAPHDEVTIMRPTWQTVRDDRTWIEPRGDTMLDEPVWDSDPADPSPLAPWTLPMAGAFGSASVTDDHGSIFRPRSPPDSAEQGRNTPWEEVTYAVTEPPPSVATGTGRVTPQTTDAAADPPPPPAAGRDDDRRHARGSAPRVSGTRHGTLPGIAVAPERRSAPDVLRAERPSPDAERAAPPRDLAAPAPAMARPWPDAEAGYATEPRDLVAPEPRDLVAPPPLKPWILPLLIPPERPAPQPAPAAPSHARWWIAVAILVITAGAIAAFLRFAA